MAEHEPFDPCCDKCGHEITTGLMAAFCPRGRECEFWCEELETFLSDPHTLIIPLPPLKKEP